MLQLIETLINKPVMSIRTGGRVAMTVSAIINPNNLKIEGLYCTDRYDKKKKLVLLYQDIRDVIDKGIIVNDHESLSEPGELVRLKDIIKINFELIGKPVYTKDKKRVGKVNDYALETSSMYVQKLYVSRSLIKNLAGGSLSIDRNQIIEITSRKIVINDLLEPAAVDAQPSVATA